VSVSDITTATAVSAGGFHTCALDGSGRVWCWGSNDHGQLGDGSTTPKATPIQVSSLGNAIAISAGRQHSCVVMSGGVLYCWGYNAFGQLGIGSIVDSATPAQVQGVSSVSMVSAGGGHTCGLSGSGQIWCVGSNTAGQIGDGTLGGQRSDPFQVPGVSGAVWAAASRSNHSCAFGGAAGSWCWGQNQHGELGDNAHQDETAPVEVTGGLNFAMGSAGKEFTCAVTKDGAAYCWGSNDHGKLGGGTNADWVGQPSGVVGLAAGVQEVSAGSDHACALRDDQSLWCWGAGDQGQLGNAGQHDSDHPVRVVAGP